MTGFAESTLYLSLRDTVVNAVDPVRFRSREERSPAPPPTPSEKPPLPARPPNPARTIAQVGGAAMGLMSLPLELANTGFAVLTAPLAAVIPAMPAATMGSLYIGPPHGHLHPPSLTPPATAPIPLPSMGPIMLGTTIKVLIGGMPAARAGDIGIAPTCCGIMPMFEVFTGSSNVFISGMRAARVGDLVKACLPSTSGPVRGMARAMRIAGTAVGVAGIAADAIDAAEEPDPAMASASAFAATMDAASMAVDAASAAIAASMGRDVAVPPSMGALITGEPTVLIGGFPMVNIPDPIHLLIEKLGKRRKKSKPPHEEDEEGMLGCKTCPVPRR